MFALARSRRRPRPGHVETSTRSPLRPPGRATSLILAGALALLVGTPTAIRLEAQGGEVRREEIPAPLLPYGLAFDGSSFWYSDLRSRSVVRMPASTGGGGRPRRFSVGNRRLYGLDYDLRTASLYLGIERGLLKINPLSGGIEETIPIPAVERVAGVAFGPDLWYLLEKGNGVIHYYDPELGRVISRLQTGRAELRDVTYYRNNLWATDGEEGVIVRYSPETREITGTLKGPHPDLRGITFADGQLWMVYRGRNSLMRVPYTEDRFYLASGERRYRIRVTVRFRIPSEGADGRVVVLQPANTTSQRIRGVRAVTAGWTNRSFLASGDRAFELNRKVTGPVELEYEFSAETRDVRYFVPPERQDQGEPLESSPARHYFDDDDEAFNEGDPFARLLDVLEGRASPAENYAPVEALNEAGLAWRWTRQYVMPSDSDPNALPQERYVLEVYAPGIGWLPLDPRDREAAAANEDEEAGGAAPAPAEDAGDAAPENAAAPGQDDLAARQARIFERNARAIELYRQPDGRAETRSPVYVLPGEGEDDREFQALEATVRVQVSSR